MTAPSPRLLLLIFYCFTAVLLATLALLLATEKRTFPTPPDYQLGTIGGLHYQAVLGRPMNPSNPVDARILNGLPRKDRPGKNQILFGAFVAVANDSSRPQPTATRIELRDDALRVYHPLRLPAANRYAYRPGTVAPGTDVPRNGTAAADNLAAGGELLLFRVPAWQYRNGLFELLVHDPLHVGVTRTLIV